MSPARAPTVLGMLPKQMTCELGTSEITDVLLFTPERSIML